MHGPINVKFSKLVVSYLFTG